MTEDKINELLKEYTSEIVASRDLRWRMAHAPTKASAFKGPLFRLAIATVAIGLIGGATIVYPRVALASTIRRVQSAISDARSMEYELFFENPDGTSERRLRVSYLNGVWRIEKAGGFNPSLVLRRGGTIYAYWKQRGFATGQPDSGTRESRDLTAIEYAREFSEEGSETPVVRRIEDHAAVDGRSTYAIIADRAEDHLHSVVVVDKQTNLPISTNVTILERGHEIHQYANYWFNRPLDPELFEPQFGANVTLIDLPTEWRKLREKWAKPISEIHEGNNSVQIRDIRANQNGEIFLAYTSHGSWLPTNVSDGRGIGYLTYGPFTTESTADPRATYIDGNELGVIRWVPLETPKAALHSVTIGFGPVDPAQSPISYHLADPTNAKSKVTLSLQAPIKGVYPDYSAAILLTRRDIESVFIIPEMKGDYYHLLAHEEARAIPHYWEQFAALKEYVPVHAWKPLEKIVECLKQLGRNAEAAKVGELLEKFKAKDPFATRG